MLASNAARLGAATRWAGRRWMSSDKVKVTASMVKELRDRTGSPMMECKKALSDPEVNGDMQAATEWLRKQGVAMAAKKMDRAMNDGLIGLALGKRVACLIDVSSETDFVARNEQFQNIVKDIGETALGLGATGDVTAALLKASTPSGDGVAEALVQGTATMGENLGLKSAFGMAVERGVIGTYVHQVRGEPRQLADGSVVSTGTQGALVAVEADADVGDINALQEFANKLAMHLVGAQAQFLDAIPSSVEERERAIEMERLLNEANEKSAGKEVDPAVLESRASKKVEKLLKKMREEEILLDQQFVSMDASLTGKVSKALQTAGKAAGAKLSVPVAVRFRVGAESQTVLTPVKP